MQKKESTKQPAKAKFFSLAGRSRRWPAISRVMLDIIPPEAIRLSAGILGVKKYTSKKSLVFGYGWRALIGAFLFLYLAAGLSPIDLYRQTVRALFGGALSVEFYTNNCDVRQVDAATPAAWQNPQGATLQPDIAADDPTTNYNATNSAYYIGGSGDLVCSGFRQGRPVEPIISETVDLGAIEATTSDETNVSDQATDVVPGEKGAVATTTAEQADQAGEEMPEVAATDSASTTVPEETDGQAASDPAGTPIENEQITAPDQPRQEPVTVPTETADSAVPMPDQTGEIEPTAAEGSIADTVISLFGRSGIFARQYDYGSRIVSSYLKKSRLEALAQSAGGTRADGLGRLESARINFSLAAIIPDSRGTEKPDASSTRALTIEPGAGTETDEGQSSSTDEIVVWFAIENPAAAGNKLWRELAVLPLSAPFSCGSIRSDYTCSERARASSTNGGYLSFDAPFITDQTDLASIEIKLEGRAASGTSAGLYLDSVWLTANYDESREEHTDDGYEPADSLTLDGRQVDFTYTDENSDENIIIKTDSARYQGVVSTDVYFSLTNISDRAETVDLQVHFPRDAGRVGRLQRLKDGAWIDTSLTDDALPGPSIIEEMLGTGIERKAVPETLTVKNSMQGPGTLLGAGKAQYFKMTITYPALSAGEFYIEAVGDGQGYGLLDPWWNSQWSYKMPITVDNTGNADTLTDYQLYVEIASTSADFWSHVKADGSDIRFTNSTETTQLDYWIASWDRTASTAAIWIQVNSIPAASSSNIYLYYGNSAAATSSSMYNTFNYAAMQDLYYVVNNNLSNASVTVVSLIDNNQVQLDNQTAVDLNRQGITTFSAPAATSTLRAKGPVMARLVGKDNVDALVPISFAATKFAVPSGRNSENFYLYAPFTGATTTIYDASSSLGTVYAAVNGAAATTSAITSMVILESTNPVLLSFDNDGPADGLVPYPATTRDLYGVRSDNNYIGITTDATSFNIYCSGGGSTAVSGQNRGDLYTNTTCNSGAEGTGEAVRLAGISAGIGAIQQDDSDGDESTTFLPESEFSSEYMLPTNGAYIAVVCAPDTGTVNLSIYDENNAFVTSGTCVASGNDPGKAYFGAADATTYNVGTRIVSTDTPAKPFYAYYEDTSASGAAGGDENNLWGAAQARKFTSTAPSYSLGAEVVYTEVAQIHYRWRNDNGNETAATWKAAEDTGITGQIRSQNMRLRFSLDNTANTAASDYQYRLQVAARGIYDDCASVPAGNFTDVPTTTASNPVAVMSTSAYYNDQATTTNQLTAAGTFTPGRLVESPSNETAVINMAYGEFTEAEYVLNLTDYAVSNAYYCFRATNRGTSLASYGQVASARAVGITISGRVFADEASTVWAGCGGTSNISLVVNRVLVASTNCSAGFGSYTFSNVDISATQPLSVFMNGGGVADKGVIVSKTANSYTDITVNVRKNRFWIKTETGAGEINNAELNHCDSDGPAACANVPYSVVTGSLTLEPVAKLIINSSTAYRPEGSLTLSPGALPADVGGDILISSAATLYADSNAVSIGGDWNDQGTFSANTNQTVTFTATGTGHTIAPGTNHFQNLAFNGSGGGWTFSAAPTIDFDLTVSAGTLSGSTNITVAGGDATGNGTINMTGGTFLLTGTGNLGGAGNWTFYNLTIGNGSSPASSLKTGAGNMTIDGVLNVSLYHNLYAYQNTWTLTGSGTPLLLSGGFVPQTSTFKFTSNNNINITPSTFYRLELSPSAAGTPTYTILGGTLSADSYFYIGDGVNAVTVDADTYDPALDLNNDVYIGSGAALSAPSAGDFTVAGSWQNSGAFTGNGGSLTFDATTTGKTIEPGGSAFSRISFNNAGGGWTVIGNATSTSDWTLAAGANFTATPIAVIEIGGAFSNNLAAASTTWTGTTLYLNGASSTINTRTSDGDHYDILKIGVDTDARMWNSVADSYEIDPTGSLYSMDHGSVDGHLYIWGDYHVVAGRTDNWSYGTDYDGTSLSGAERQAVTYIASSSAVTVDAGILNIAGTTTATSTITYQTDGAYALTVNGGSLDASYYQIRNIDVNGLNISGSSTINSLAYGDFEVSREGGSAIRVVAAAIDANPAKVIYGCRFATSTGITSGYNVVLTGTPVSDWRFTQHYGAMAGEAFDSDPGDPGGFILWDDSMSYLPRSKSWQWYHDQSAETPVIAAAASNTAPSGIARDNMLKLRLTLLETDGMAGTGVKMRLQYSTFSDFSSDVNFVGEIGSTTALWNYGNGVDSDNASVTARLLLDSTVTATHNESGSSTSIFVHPADTAAEWEFTVLNNAAAFGTTYYFRAYSEQYADKAVSTDTGESYPSISAGDASLDLATSGLPAGSSTEGVLLDVTSTANAVAFGNITIGAQLEAAQRLVISTNAEYGYQLFVYGRQNLLNNNGAAISAISATNESPATWPASPDPSGFGYHAGDDTLSGASPSRFAANDTYARFETAMKEVGYDPTPAAAEMVDMIYKLEITDAEQSAGDYQTELVYIVVPTY